MLEYGRIKGNVKGKKIGLPNRLHLIKLNVPTVVETPLKTSCIIILSYTMCQQKLYDLYLHSKFITCVPLCGVCENILYDAIKKGESWTEEISSELRIIKMKHEGLKRLIFNNQHFID